MIPSNGVYRVRRRRFVEVRSADAAKEGSTMGGSGKGGSNNRLVSVSILSSSVSCSMQELSTFASECIKTVVAGRRGARAGDIMLTGRRGARIGGKL